MTAAVTSASGRFGAPRRARVRAGVGFVYIAGLAGATLARSASVANMIRVGIEAAAQAVVLSSVFIVLAAVVVAVRTARLGVDEDGVSWGWGGLSFSVSKQRIRLCRIYSDAAAVVMGRGSTWYLTARDYTPYAEVAAALRRSGIPLEEHAGRAPLAARLQGYGLALDTLLMLAVLGATGLYLVA